MDPTRIFSHIFTVEVAIAAVVFALVCLAMLTAVLVSHRRKRQGSPPWRTEELSLAEGAYAVAIAAVVGVVVALSFHARAQESAHSRADATRVDVTAFQWCWRFGYPGNRSVTGTCQGSDLPTMVVPIGRPVQVAIRSTDVIHSWWVPALRYKLDAFPAHTNTVTIKLDHGGTWIGRCAEFCGHRHTYMDFYLKAVPEQQYQHWLASGAL